MSIVPKVDSLHNPVGELKASLDLNIKTFLTLGMIFWTGGRMGDDHPWHQGKRTKNILRLIGYMMLKVR